MKDFVYNLKIAVLDKWIAINKNWNYSVYILCDIADKLYLLEKEI